MDGDGSGFPFPTGSDFAKGQESEDISWGDMFLDGIGSAADDSGGDIASSLPDVTLPPQQNLLGTGTQMQVQLQQQSSINKSQQNLSTNIPTHIQGTLTTNAVQQPASTVVGTAYLTPSSQQQQGRPMQNLVSANHAQASVSQQQGNAKLVQIAPSSFNMASQLSSGVPMQTILQQSGQPLATQPIYSQQNAAPAGLFPAQGSVHIENPKVVNVNFGPHVIQSDNSGQQAIIQTAEGKRVLITNTQLQNMAQSINLTQSLVGTQLLNPASMSVSSVIRANAPTIVSSTNAARPILLPTGQTVIPRPAAGGAGQPKNVVIRQLNQNITPVLGNMAGQLLQSQPTLIATSGAAGGLQVVNAAAANQANQVQLITAAQPATLNQTSVPQQQMNQGALMNLLGNAGVVPGQNIFVNGQMLNLSQLGGLPQLQATNNSQGLVTLANRQLISNTNNSNSTNSHQQQLKLIQQNGQVLLQAQSSASPSLQAQKIQQQGLQQGRTPTPSNNSSAGSASSTPAPTPSTPTPSDLMADLAGPGSKNQSINILEQALELSDIDLQSYEDDFSSFLDNPGELTSSMTPPPPSVTPVLPQKPKPQPKSKQSKTSKSKAKPAPPAQPQPPTVMTPGQQLPPGKGQQQKVTITPQQKIITANGQLLVLSANGQQLIVQKGAPATAQGKPLVTASLNTAQQAGQLQIKSQPLATSAPAPTTSTAFTPNNLLITTNSQAGGHVLIKSASDSSGKFKLEPVKQAATVAVSTPQAAVPASNIPHVTVKAAGLSQITTLGGKVVKQEQPTVLVKQEPISELLDPSGVFPNVSSPAVVSSSGSSLVSVSFSGSTLTSQSQLASIMTSQPAVCAAAGQPIVSSHPSICPPGVDKPDKPEKAHGKKERASTKDPANIKVMTPIKIANTTLTLSLTPQEKERFENELSRMSPQKQNEFLVHQQKIIQRSKEILLKKQMEQQQKVQEERQQQQQLQLQKQQQVQKQQQLLHQQKQQQQRQQLQQKQQALQEALDRQQKESPVASSQKLAAGDVNSSSSSTGMADLTSSQQGDSSAAFPVLTTLDKGKGPGGNLPTPVQELMNAKPVEEKCSELSSTTDSASSSQVQKTVPGSVSPHPASQTASPAPASSQANLAYQQQLGNSRAEQQLMRDCSLALNPDVTTPFKNLSDAMRRLVRYHTLQDHKPELDSETMNTWDTKYNKLSDYLMKRKRCYMRRFSKLMLYQDMCPDKKSESIQNLMCFNDQLRGVIAQERELAQADPEAFIAKRESEMNQRPISPPLQPYSEDLEEEEEEEDEDDDYENENEDEDDDDSEEDEEELDNSHYSISHSSSPDRDSLLYASSPVPAVHSRIPPVQSVRSSVSIKSSLVEEKASTGTLKLVFKRRTTDNFVVKNSLEDSSSQRVPEALKPVVNLEKSDSEYEFDSRSNVSENASVRVRRRTLSTSSRIASLEGGSECSSSLSSSRKDTSLSTEENPSDDFMEDEEGEESGMKSEVEEDVEEMIPNCVVPSRKRSHHHVSFSNSQTLRDSMERTPPDLDVFSKKKFGASVFKYSNISSASDSIELPNGAKYRRKLSNLSRDLSDEVFNVGPTFPMDVCMGKQPAAPANKVSRGCISPALAAAPHQHSPAPPSSNKASTMLEFPSPESPPGVGVSSLEKEAARRGLPNSSLFTTPNKSLLQTEDMFNSSDDEDSVGQASRTSSVSRFVSNFEIDNKDPQSSMVNESVRSAISSFLEEDDDDEDHGMSPTVGWSASSVLHRRHTSSSSGLPRRKEMDLDMAVKSIANS